MQFDQLTYSYSRYPFSALMGWIAGSLIYNSTGVDFDRESAVQRVEEFLFSLFMGEQKVL